MPKENERISPQDNLGHFDIILTHNECNSNCLLNLLFFYSLSPLSFFSQHHLYHMRTQQDVSSQDSKSANTASSDLPASALRIAVLRYSVVTTQIHEDRRFGTMQCLGSEDKLLLLRRTQVQFPILTWCPPRSPQ